jgi:hypothetical protein
MSDSRRLYLDTHLPPSLFKCCMPSPPTDDALVGRRANLNSDCCVEFGFQISNFFDYLNRTQRIEPAQLLANDMGLQRLYRCHDNRAHGKGSVFIGVSRVIHVPPMPAPRMPMTKLWEMAAIWSKSFVVSGTGGTGSRPKQKPLSGHFSGQNEQVLTSFEWNG